MALSSNPSTLSSTSAASAGALDVAPKRPDMPRSDGVVSTSPAPVLFVKRFAGILTFWNVVPIIGLIGIVYLNLFADQFYASIALVNLQNSSSMSTSLSSLAGSSLLGSTGGSTESGEVMAYIESPEMLRILDKKFHLRELYSSPSHNMFWRLAPGASDEDFLAFYQQMVVVSQDPTTLLITIQVLDWDSNRAQAINKAVLAAATNFVTMLTKTMQDATIKYAKDQLVFAWNAVETAQAVDRPVAEAELSSAEQAMASAQSMASQQVVFLIPVSNATAPNDTAEPDAYTDEAGILLVASIVYMIGHILLSNVRDHRKI